MMILMARSGMCLALLRAQEQTGHVRDRERWLVGATLVRNLFCFPVMF
jgi:hypothetical protein